MTDVGAHGIGWVHYGPENSPKTELFRVNCERNGSQHGQNDHRQKNLQNKQTKQQHQQKQETNKTKTTRDDRVLGRLELKERFSTLEQLQQFYGTLRSDSRSVKYCIHALDTPNCMSAWKSLIDITNRGRRVCWSTVTMPSAVQDHWPHLLRSSMTS